MKKPSLTLCAILLLVIAAHAADNYLGTWALNVAKDGKSRTNEASFTNAKGVKVHNIIFFDRK